MNTLFMLMAAHSARPVIDDEQVRQAYFAHLTLPVFRRKLDSGEIPLPFTQMERSQKAPRMITLTDLAEYIDRQAERGRQMAAKMAVR